MLDGSQTESEENLFSSTNFNAHQYVSLITNGNITVAKLKDQHEQIVALSDKTAQDLKNNVFKNYKRFIEASKEICKLDSEMRNIEHALSEDEKIFDSINTLVTTGSADGMEQKTDHQSRLQQVQDIDWSDPLAAGECIHQGRFTFVQPENHSHRGVGHGFLLMNSFVFATYAQYGRSTRKKKEDILILESMEPLKVFKVKDMRDSIDFKNAIVVEGSTSPKVLVCSSVREKKAWLAEFRQAPGVEVEGDQAPMGDDDNHEWLHDVPEDLDVYLAQRDFENSVQIACKAQTLLSAHHASSSNQALASLIEDKIGILIDTLCSELKRPAMRMNSTRSTVQYLLQLGETDRAHQMYLKNRSDTIRSNIRKLKMEGSTELYVMKLSHSFFSTLRSTCIEFNELFDNNTKSAFVVWATKELEEFATSFKQQVLQPITKFPTIAKCVPEVMRQCNLLNKHGLDLEFVLWRLIEKRTIEAIADAGRELQGSVSYDIEDEIWVQQEFNGNHAKKLFIDKMTARQFTKIEDYIDNKKCVLFESTTSLVCKMVEWIDCLVLLCEFEVLVKTMTQRVVDTLQMYLKAGIIKHKRSGYEDVFQQNMQVVLWIAENAVSKLTNDANAAATFDTLRKTLKSTWERSTTDSVSFI